MFMKWSIKSLLKIKIHLLFNSKTFRKRFSCRVYTSKIGLDKLGKFFYFLMFNPDLWTLLIFVLASLAFIQVIKYEIIFSWLPQLWWVARSSLTFILVLSAFVTLSFISFFICMPLKFIHQVSFHHGFDHSVCYFFDDQ